MHTKNTSTGQENDTSAHGVSKAGAVSTSPQLSPAASIGRNQQEQVSGMAAVAAAAVAAAAASKTGKKLQQLGNKLRLRGSKTTQPSSSPELPISIPDLTILSTSPNKPASYQLSLLSETSASLPCSTMKPRADKSEGSFKHSKTSGKPSPEAELAAAGGVGENNEIALESSSVEGVREFRESSHPTANPLAPLITQFRKMKPLVVPRTRAGLSSLLKSKRASAAASAAPAVPAPMSPLPEASIISPMPTLHYDTPPMGFLWLWMGRILRWQRRFFAASESPGVVMIYKRMNMKGKVSSISLRNALVDVIQDDPESRQLRITTPAGQIFLRAQDEQERDWWYNCLMTSINLYQEKQLLVHGLREQGLLPPSLVQGFMPSYSEPIPPRLSGPRQRDSSSSSHDYDSEAVPVIGTSTATSQHLPAPTSTLSRAPTGTLLTAAAGGSSSTKFSSHQNTIGVVRRSPEAAGTSLSATASHTKQIRSSASEDNEELEGNHTTAVAAAAAEPVGRISSSGLPPLSRTSFRLRDLTAEIDVEQRRRIRVRVGQRLAEITPYQQEVERHMSLLSSQLLAVVSGLNVRVGMMTPTNSNVKLSHFLANTSARGAVRGSSQAAVQMPHLQPAVQQGLSPQAAAAAAAAASWEQARIDAEESGCSSAGATHTEAGIPRTAVGSASTTSSGRRQVSGPAIAPFLRLPAVRTTSLQQAYGQLLEAFRIGMHGEATRIAQLEAENQAMSRAMQLMKAKNEALLLARRRMAGFRVTGDGRSLSRSSRALLPANSGDLERGSTGMLDAAGRAQLVAGASSEMAESSVYVDGVEGGEGGQDHDQQAVQHSSGSESEDVDEDNVSVMTADEDAFDVLEPFDELVDYDILDDPDRGVQRYATHSPRRKTASRKARRRLDLAYAAGGSTSYQGEGSDLNGDGDEEEDSQDDAGNTEEEETLEETEVLKALEVVRQVEYVERALQRPGSFASIIASHGPPPPRQVGGGTSSTEDGEHMPRQYLQSDTGGEEEEDVTSCSDGKESLSLSRGGSASRNSTFLTGSGRILAVADTSKQRDISSASRSSTQVQQGHSAPVNRDRLPAAKPLGRGFSVWSMLKNMIGKDLTKITMPATINEPLDMLQRLAETFEYYSLIERAAAEQDSTTRMMLVAVWQLSCYNSQAHREGKPFNPLLGETYEWQSQDRSVKYLCEQVSHHPPVSAYHAQGGMSNIGTSAAAASASNVGGGKRVPAWEVQGEFEIKTKFWGKSIELILEGCESLKLHDHGEEYRWNRATICVQDIIMGNYWSEVYGKVTIENKQTGDSALLNLKPCKGRLEDRGKFDGVVRNGAGKEVYRLHGSTMDKVYASLTHDAAVIRGKDSAPVLMWEKESYPEDSEVQYNFTRFAISLNDPGDALVPYLPPTDARFRPDQRALELGEFARATSEKLRLEEKQRAARHALKDSGKVYKPLWFTQERPTAAPVKSVYRSAPKPVLTRSREEDGFVWAFNGEYWKQREVRSWEGCPDLYS
ncbi:hypothetical protein CEUSTIGMA_g6491.t1 [Chlamydomonas eustigma]|uniref:PH domain-containing protein n=1 Tax=Chlamydomonas eustigma TaxID=1157962 RepID=A0A250X7I5_9CHLO|nr:hypothetical protein CEUSTIGMA_g6491.t1 [Chlamydomonas eustigma]|eukprot:GAX79051.1 hypothetical protein CEUSTIGMA_g6491.t1 [Chlamydomonas eustigma]